MGSLIRNFLSGVGKYVLWRSDKGEEVRNQINFGLIIMLIVREMEIDYLCGLGKGRIGSKGIMTELNDLIQSTIS